MVKFVAEIVAVSMLTKAFEVLRRHLPHLQSSAERYRSSFWRAEGRQRFRAVKIVEAEQPFAGILFVVGAILCYSAWSVSPHAKLSDQIVPLIASCALLLGTISNYEILTALIALPTRVSRILLILILSSAFAALTFSQNHHLISRFLSFMILWLVLHLMGPIYVLDPLMIAA